MKKALLTAALAVAAIAPATTQAATIDFDTYTPLYDYSPVSVGGLTFQSVGASSFGAVWDNNPTSSNGTAAYIYGFGGLSITPTAGGSFDLGSFLGGISWYTASTNAIVDYTFDLLGGGTTTGSLNLAEGFQSYNFGVSGITKATFTGLSDGYIAIDNVSAVVSAVPEPGTWVLMILGFAGLGVSMRYRRNRGTRVTYA